MARKRLTQLFPFLLPLRRWQKKRCFYLKMRLDRNRYAAQLAKTRLPYPVFEDAFTVINPESGYDIAYQYNKAHNLKLAAATMDGLVIAPGETYSFWMLCRYADKKTPYKPGLSLVDGKIRGVYGGGLCQLSDLVLWLVLHTPLTIVERHPHTVKDFPAPGMPEGVDATVSEGWLDLKVRNDTEHSYQLLLDFPDELIRGRILCSEKPQYDYCLRIDGPRYFTTQGKVYERADVYRARLDPSTGEGLEEKLLYKSCTRIGYPLPAGTAVERRDA